MAAVPITGEVSNSKLAAVFEGEGDALAAVDALVADGALQRSQVRLLTPRSKAVDIQLEPEGGGIWRTIVRAHLWLGAAGLVVGGLVFAAMWLLGVPYVRSSPLATALWWIFYGGVGGLFLGGLVALRPDHDPYVQAARRGIRAGRFVVVVHALTRAQQADAAAALEARGAEVTRTL